MDKPVKCACCKAKASGKNKAGWIWIGKDGLAFISTATSLDKKYCIIVSQKWYCSIECLDSYLWKRFDISSRKTKRLLKAIKAGD